MLSTKGRIVPDCVAFSDESKYNTGRWRSIGLVSIQYKNVLRLQDKLNNILIESKIDEFKWAKFKTAKYRFGAEKMIDCIVPECKSGNVRIDIIVWDTHDSRHAIQGRDDIANLGRMYFHLMKNVANKRWFITYSWNFYPDEQSSMDWNTLSDCVNHATRTSKLVTDEQELFTPFAAMNEFRIRHLMSRPSKEEPFIQLADMFAGMATYSRNCYNKYCYWKELSSGQGSLFNNSEIKQSNADEERCKTIHEFVNKCKDLGMTVSIDRDSGLKTYNPNDPINFWKYVPQHSKDIAPIRSNKS
jgi:hypothetical protein